MKLYEKETNEKNSACESATIDRMNNVRNKNNSKINPNVAKASIRIGGKEQTSKRSVCLTEEEKC